MLALLAQIATVPATPASGLGFGWLFIKMLIVLVIVCLFAIIMLKYVVPRLGLAGKMQAGKYIHLLSRLSLDPRKNLWIVRVGARHFLLGSGDGAVTKIAELDAKDVEGG